MSAAGPRPAAVLRNREMVALELAAGSVGVGAISASACCQGWPFLLDWDWFPPFEGTELRPVVTDRLSKRPMLKDNCQWPIVCAHGRSAEMPAGGHENCPAMASRSAHRVFGGVGHVGMWV